MRPAASRGFGGATPAVGRAPTLMAGAEAGRQGCVRVWAPHSELIWRAILAESLEVAGILVVASFAFLGCGLVCEPEMFWVLFDTWPYRFLLAVAGIILVVAVAGWLAVMASPELHRRYYLTTDDAGIGITGQTGSMALPWTDITAIRLVGRRFPHLALKVQFQGRVDARLYGYSEEERLELIRLIATRADLVQPFAGRLDYHR